MISGMNLTDHKHSVSDMITCSKCSCTYSAGGDGYNGLCPHCADATEGQGGLRNRDLNMILSALRLAQRKIGEGCDFSQCEIATNGFEDLPLTPSEIDTLCKRLNSSDDIMNISVSGIAGLEAILDDEDMQVSSDVGDAIVDIIQKEPANTITFDITGITRADLAAIGDVRHDSTGNPCVWENHYTCDHGPFGSGEPASWESRHSSQCDDNCPVCDADVSPHESKFMEGIPDALRAIWEMLPEAG